MLRYYYFVGFCAFCLKLWYLDIIAIQLTAYLASVISCNDHLSIALFLCHC